MVKEKFVGMGRGVQHEGKDKTAPSPPSPGAARLRRPALRRRRGERGRREELLGGGWGFPRVATGGRRGGGYSFFS